jgi:uncharacterized protein DUF5615
VSALFIELYLDEDVDVLVAKLLRARGFVAVTTLEAGRLEAADADQLEFAVSQHKTFLTHNREHFETLAQNYLEEGRTHHGIILAVRRPPHQIVRKLLAILNHVTADEMIGQIRYV